MLVISSASPLRWSARLTPCMTGARSRLSMSGTARATSSWCSVCLARASGVTQINFKVPKNVMFIFSYVLNAYEYDDSEFQGPPRNLPRDEVFNLFGKFCRFKSVTSTFPSYNVSCFPQKTKSWRFWRRQILAITVEKSIIWVSPCWKSFMKLNQQKCNPKKVRILLAR